MKRITPYLFAAMLTLALPALAQDGLLGKGGKGGGGGGSGNSGGGQGGGGGSAPPPPVKSGGGQSGGSGGSGGLGRGSGSSGGSSNSSQTNRDRNSSNSNSQSNDALLNRRSSSSTSRSGEVQYGSNSNRGVDSRTSPSIPPPPVLGSSGRVSREAVGESRVTRVENQFRSGYHHYDNRWVDDYFWYPHYRFTYSPNCAPSPWYHYTHLPPYISTIRIEFATAIWNWDTGNRYSYRYANNRGGWSWDSRRNELDQSIDDIYDAFRTGRMRYMSWLIPSRDWVHVDMGRYAQYRLRGDDFYDLMQDLVEGTYTRDYRIRDVREWRDGATVVAEHVYLDSWGRQNVSRHYYGLRPDRRGYVIASFRVDN
ncbi:hypothetical protein QPK87_18295 [Kamptonema cortianum]|nr:hypothetical protein [Geitlerinema splendidum]MDK3158508.1 hypothetical protein [Kamptonema cortianum]